MKNDYDAPDDDLSGDYYESDGLRWISIVVVILVIFGFFSLAWYAYRTNKENAEPGQEMLVTAEDGPMREKPTDPGGLKIEHQDKEVYNRIIAKNGSEQPDEVETLLPEPEEPVVQKSVKSDESGIQTWINGKLHNEGEQQPEKPAVAELAKNEVAEEPAADAPESPDAEDKAAVTKEKTTEKAEKEPAETTDEKPVEVTEAKVVTEAKPTKEAAPAIKEVPKPEEKIAAKPVPVTPKESVKPAAAAADPIVSAAEGYAKPAVTPAKTSGSYQAQIASLPTRAAAEETLARLRSKHSDVLGGKTFAIVSADIPGKGTYYRIRITGISDKSSLTQICSALKNRGQDCIPIN